MIFKINGCTVDTEAYELRRDGVHLPVEPQVFDLLVFLLENPGKLVTKQEITDRIWDGRIVSDSAVSTRIKAVRQAIGDDGSRQNVIQTVRRRGFRLVADVSADETPVAAADPAEPVLPLPQPSAGHDYRADVRQKRDCRS